LLYGVAWAWWVCIKLKLTLAIDFCSKGKNVARTLMGLLDVTMKGLLHSPFTYVAGSLF